MVPRGGLLRGIGVGSREVVGGARSGWSWPGPRPATKVEEREGGRRRCECSVQCGWGFGLGRDSSDAARPINSIVVLVSRLSQKS
jgi:hypothetical protein